MTRRCKDCIMAENKKLKEKLEKIKKSLHTCSIRCKKCSIQNFCQTYKMRKIIEGAEE